MKCQLLYDAMPVRIVHHSSCCSVDTIVVDATTGALKMREWKMQEWKIQER